MFADVIRAIGSPAFGKTLFAVARREFAIRQMTIYRYVPRKPVQTIAAESAGEDRMLHEVLRRYLHRLHKRDPFQPFLLPSDRPEVVLRSIDAEHIEDLEFRDRLYRPFGMAGKMSLILRRPADAIAISFFRGCETGAFHNTHLSSVDASSDILAACVERHLSLREPFHRDNLAALIDDCRHFACNPPLSNREAGVCGRVVAGWTTEAIALDLGVSFHSVVTYKRRAYGKLKIGSQGELFALLLSSRNAGAERQHLSS